MGAGLADEQSLTLSFQNNGFRPERSRITVVRLVPRLLIVQSPPSEKVELVEVEKQTMTLVLSIREGCKVELSSQIQS